MVESNRSASPRREADLKLAAISRREPLKDTPNFAPFTVLVSPFPAGMENSTLLRSGTETLACFTAPLVLRKSRLRSTMVRPRQRITIRGEAVTTATGYASRFSAWAAETNFSAFSGATTTAIRS